MTVAGPGLSTKKSSTKKFSSEKFSSEKFRTEKFSSEKFSTENEVNSMISAVVFDRMVDRMADAPVAQRHRPRGLDRMAMRLGVALLIWGRTRTEKAALTGEEHTRLRRDDNARRAREFAAQLEFPHRPL